MLVEIHQPETLSPTRLDKLLALGWFRTSSSISRIQYLCMNEAVGSVINIRARLQNYQFSKGFRKIIAQNNKRFAYIISKMTTVDDLKERLYQLQKHKFEIFVMDNLQIFLYDYQKAEDCLFNTYEVCVYDGDKLVAVSFFDLGKYSVASILGLYDADYQKYSLGTYTMLLEIEFAQKHGFRFYYPGYVVLGENGYSFGYKLRLANLQFRDSTGKWRSIEKLEKQKWIHQIFQAKRQEIENCFTTHCINYQYIIYPYFAIAQFITFEQCLMMPFFFKINIVDKDYLVLEYLMRTETYRLGFVSILDSIFFEMMTENVKLSEDFYLSAKYEQKPLKYDEILLEASSLEAIMHKLSAMGG
jgi:arginine-tRNA-protein transferase